MLSRSKRLDFIFLTLRPFTAPPGHGQRVERHSTRHIDNDTILDSYFFFLNFVYRGTLREERRKKKGGPDKIFLRVRGNALLGRV